MMMSEQYSMDQLREIFKLEARNKRETTKALNQRIRELKQQKQLMEFKAFSEPAKSNKKVRRFVFLAKQEPLNLEG